MDNSRFRERGCKSSAKRYAGSKMLCLVLQRAVPVLIEVKGEKLFEESVKFSFIKVVAAGCKRRRKEQTRTDLRKEQPLQNYI